MLHSRLASLTVHKLRACARLRANAAAPGAVEFVHRPPAVVGAAAEPCVPLRRFKLPGTGTLDA
jgi:hypothetical protein